jgi:hypothetical protein
MPNLHRGEIEAEIGGTRRRLVLTLGALAELEAAFGADDLTALAERRQPRWRGDVRSRARVGKRADIRAGVSAVHPCLIRHKGSRLFRRHRLTTILGWRETRDRQ